MAKSKSTREDRTYDAIVVGGGHNGLTNAAYLAKSGLRVLVLERRAIVGGAAITEELRPGYWFTTFSYALSLLRPDIIHDLDLVKHGFMPILMPSTFCPKEDGDYLLLGQDHGENHKEIERHSKHDADAYDAFNHDVNKVLQAIKPLLDEVPPDIFSDDPEELIRLAALGSGSEYHAPVVVSALDPRRTFMELVDPRELPTDLVDAIRRFRFQGTSAKVNFALDGVPRYPALGDRTDQYRGFTNIGPSMEYLEHAFDDAKYGWYSKRPYLDCAIQSTVDPDMAPPGKAVMSCFVQYAPYKLRESDWDTEKQGLGDTVQATLESFFPGFGKLVLQREVRTPLDIERTVGLSEGNIFAGEFLAPQMYFFRPAPGWSQYRTPIEGYYQCGSGTHPGGCVMGAPGKLAAGQVLKDRERGRLRGVKVGGGGAGARGAAARDGNGTGRT